MDFWTLMLLPFTEWEILVSSTLFFFILGMFWYMPNTPTGKIWATHVPMPKKKPSFNDMLPYFVGQLVLGMIFVHTAILIWMIGKLYGLTELLASLFIIKAFMGFVFIKELGAWLWAKKSFHLILVEVGYYLIGILFTATVLSYLL